MLKKILFTFLSLLILYSCGVVAYRLFEPTASYHIGNGEDYVDYNSLREYVTSTGESSIHYFFFYSKTDEDSVYIKNSVITSVENDTSLQFSKIIETVDITEITQNMDSNVLYEDWGISSYPAFATFTVENGNVMVSHILESSSNHIITALDIKQWLKDNDLYYDESLQ